MELCFGISNKSFSCQTPKFPKKKTANSPWTSGQESSADVAFVAFGTRGSREGFRVSITRHGTLDMWTDGQWNTGNEPDYLTFTSGRFRCCAADPAVLRHRGVPCSSLWFTGRGPQWWVWRGPTSHLLLPTVRRRNSRISSWFYIAVNLTPSQDCFDFFLNSW